MEKVDALVAKRDDMILQLETPLQQLRIGEVPITRTEWAAWLDENLFTFREKMRTAT